MNSNDLKNAVYSALNHKPRTLTYLQLLIESTEEECLKLINSLIRRGLAKKESYGFVRAKKLNTLHLNIAPLQKIVHDIVGVSPEFTCSIVEDDDLYYLHVKSKDLIGSIGVRGLFSSLYLESYGGHYRDETGIFTVPIYYKWETPESSTNGSHLVTMLYNVVSDSWSIRPGP